DNGPAPCLYLGRDLVHVRAAVAHVALGPAGEPDVGGAELEREQGYFRKDGTSKSSSPPPPRSRSSSSAPPNTSCSAVSKPRAPRRSLRPPLPFSSQRSKPAAMTVT